MVLVVSCYNPVTSQKPFNMAELLVIRRIRRRRRNRISQRLIKDREDPFSLKESDFITTYKLSKIAARDLIEEIRPFVSIEENKSYPLEIYVR